MFPIDVLTDDLAMEPALFATGYIFFGESLMYLDRKLLKCSLSLLLFFILTACGGSSGSPDTENPEEPDTNIDDFSGDAVALMIPSNGGSQTIEVNGQTINITIPAGAVAGDTQITVAALSAAAVDELIGEDELVLALDLQPSGTTFDQPLQFSFILPDDTDPASALIGLLSSGDTIEALSNFDIDISENGEQVVNFEVSHFSRAIVTTSGYEFSLDPTALTLPVDASSQVSVSLSRGNTLNVFSGIDSAIFGSTLEAFRSDQDPVFTPLVTTSGLLFNTGDIAVGRTREIAQFTVTCNRAGNDLIFLSLGARLGTSLGDTAQAVLSISVTCTGADTPPDDGGDTTGGDGGDGGDPDPDPIIPPVFQPIFVVNSISNTDLQSGISGDARFTVDRILEPTNPSAPVILITVDNCSSGVEAEVSILGEDTPNLFVNVSLRPPEVTVDTPYSCLLRVDEENQNESEEVTLSGVILAPDIEQTPPQIDVVIPGWGDSGIFNASDCVSLGAGTSSESCSEPEVAATSARYVDRRECTQSPDSEGVLRPSESGDSLFFYDCTAVESSAGVTVPSVPGSVSWQTPEGVFLFTVSNDERGVVSLVRGLQAGDELDPSIPYVAGAGGSVSEEILFYVPTAVGEDAPLPLQIDASGKILVDSRYQEVVVTANIADSESSSEVRVNQLAEVRQVSTDPEAMEQSNGLITLPLFSAGANAYIDENNIVFVGDVNLVARNTDDLDGVFPMAPDDSSPDGANPPQTVIVGAAINLPEQQVTQPIEACPLADVSAPTRCSGGSSETLLVVNGSSHVAHYSAIDGGFDGFFLSESSAVLPAAGWEATQAPDQCIVYTSTDGNLYLYDTSGSILGGDGIGNLADTSAPLLTTAGSNIGYYGFAFYETDEGVQLFVSRVTTESLGDGSDDQFTSEILRYDYDLLNNPVVSNELVVDSGINGIVYDLEVVGEVLYAASGRFGANLYDLTLTSPALVSQRGFDLAVRQIKESFTEGILLSDYDVQRLQQRSIVQESFDTPILEFSLLVDGFQPNTGRVLGVHPLRNSNFLVSGDAPLNRTIVERFDSVEFSDGLRLEPDGASASGRLIGSACLPE